MAISQQETARFDALGSIATVAVSDSVRIGAAVDAVQQAVAAFDRACSRFRDDSELSAVNRAAGTPVRVSPLMVEAVSAALRAARLTDGDVDPTVGRALIALGYDRDFDSLPTGPQAKAPVVSFASVPGWRTVELDAAAGTIRVPRGVTLDLGATAKALCADRAAANARAAAYCGVLVSLGGDMAAAGEPPEDGWRVRVTDDHRSDVDAPGQWISIRSGGLATSSTTVRRWNTGSGSVHHLVDPESGQPVTSVMAHGQRDRGVVPGREHREHCRDRSRRARGGVARVAGPAEQAGGRRRSGAPRGRLAGGRRRARVTAIGLGRGGAERLLVSDPRHGRRVTRSADRERGRGSARLAAVRRSAALAAIRDRRAPPGRVAARDRLPGRPHHHQRARQLRPDQADRRGDSVRFELSAPVDGARGPLFRPARRARGHEPGPSASRLPRLAGDSLARLRELADRGSARPGNRKRYQGVVDAGADRGVRARGRGRGVGSDQPRRPQLRPRARPGTGAVGGSADRAGDLHARGSAAARMGPPRRHPGVAAEQGVRAGVAGGRGSPRRGRIMHNLSRPFLRAADRDPDADGRASGRDRRHHDAGQRRRDRTPAGQARRRAHRRRGIVDDRQPGRPHRARGSLGVPGQDRLVAGAAVRRPGCPTAPDRCSI